MYTTHTCHMYKMIKYTINKLKFFSRVNQVSMILQRVACKVKHQLPILNVFVFVMWCRYIRMIGIALFMCIRASVFLPVSSYFGLRSGNVMEKLIWRRVDLRIFLCTRKHYVFRHLTVHNPEKGDEGYECLSIASS